MFSEVFWMREKSWILDVVICSCLVHPTEHCSIGSSNPPKACTWPIGRPALWTARRVCCAKSSPIRKLVGGDLNHGILWLSHHIGSFIIPTDELIFFRWVENANQEDTTPSKGGCWLFNKVRDSGRVANVGWWIAIYWMNRWIIWRLKVAVFDTWYGWWLILTFDGKKITTTMGYD